MSKEKLSIGQMAKINNISVQALRYYEKLHLISPIETDRQTGYRYYDIEQTATLDIIRYLKITGLSLSEIRQFLRTDKVDEHSTIKLLTEKINSIESEISRLGFQKSAIERVIRCLETSDSMPEAGTITLESFPKKYVLVYKGDVNYYQNTLSYEKGLLRLKEKMQKCHIPYFYSLNPGAITRVSSFREDRLYCNELFVYVDKPYCYDNVPFTEIPGGIYLCIYCDDVLHEEEYVRKLLAHIDTCHMSISGDCIQDCINDIIAIRSNRKHLLMRIRIPVHFSKKLNISC